MTTKIQEIDKRVENLSRAMTDQRDQGKLTREQYLNFELEEQYYYLLRCDIESGNKRIARNEKIQKVKEALRNIIRF